MEIKVLGLSCSRCHETYELVMRIVAEKGIEACVDMVSDQDEISRYGVLATPAVVIDGKVKAQGRVPAESEIEGWFSPKKPVDFWWKRKERLGKEIRKQ